jgi:hypothetical protein
MYHSFARGLLTEQKNYAPTIKYQLKRAFRKMLFNLIYLNPTAACQTKAKARKNKGIKGRTSTRGSKIEYASGNFANSIATSIGFLP